MMMIQKQAQEIWQNLGTLYLSLRIHAELSKVSP